MEYLPSTTYVEEAERAADDLVSEYWEAIEKVANHYVEHCQGSQAKVTRPHTANALDVAGLPSENPAN